MVKQLFLTVCFFVGVAGTATAHEQSMTLRECMQYAVSHSTKMRIRQADNDDLRLNRRNAILAACTPTLSGNTYAYYNFGRSIDPETNTYFNTTSFHNSYSVSAGFTLFDGFQAVNNVKISGTSMLIGKSQEKQVEADICLAVMQAFYNVLYYKRLKAVYEEQVSAAETDLVKIRRQEELGQKGRADVIQLEADLQDRKYDLINVQNMYADQLMTLCDLMFWPMDEPLEIVEPVSAEPGLLPASEESIVDYALDHDPGLRIAGWNMDNARRELNTAKWQLLPTLGLYAGWNTSYYTYQGSAADPFMDQFRHHGGEYIEMSLSIPIYNRLQRQTKIGKSRNALNKASAEYDQKRRDIESEVRRAVNDMQGAAEAYRQAICKEDIQAEAYQFNLKKLEQGLVSPLEFQTATNNWLRSKADRMDAEFKYRIKAAVVKYYNGEEYVNQD